MGTCHLFHVLTVPPKKACLLCTTPAGMDWYIQAMPVGTYQVQSPGFPKIVYWLGIRYQETPLWPVCDLPCPSLTSLILPISLWRQQLFHCHLFLISTLSLLFPFLPISTLSTSACLWCLHSYLSYLFNSHLFLTLENSFRPGFCLSLTSVPPCLWPPFHPVWPPFHPVSDFHSVLSLPSLPPCLWPPFHPVSDLLLHTVSDLHSTLSLTCLRLPVTSIPHLFSFFFTSPFLPTLSLTLGSTLSLTFNSHYLWPPHFAALDLHSCLSLTFSPHYLWPPLCTLWLPLHSGWPVHSCLFLTFSPHCLTSRLLHLRPLYPFLPLASMPACLWAVHHHPCLTYPFSSRCPNWGFSAQLCVIVFGLLTSFYALVSIGLLSLCEVPQPGLKYFPLLLFSFWLTSWHSSRFVAGL